MNRIIIIFSVFVSVICERNHYWQSNGPLTDICTVTEFDQVINATLNCKDIIISDLSVPAEQPLILNLQDGATVKFRGNNIFAYGNWSEPLIKVYGKGITVQGEKGHVINGQGELYWDGRGSWGSIKPKFMYIEANESIFKDLHFYHAPMHGISINRSHYLIFTNFIIDNAAGDKGVAPVGHEGHNTDGFGVRESTHIIIRDSKIYNQDDCVALNSGSYMYVTNLLCHGSHGLSLSVGFSNDSFELNSLSNILIENSTIIDAMDGIHIKTHIDAGEGLLTNVTYRNIYMIGSYKYGISVEQNYTNSPGGDSGALPKNNIPIKGLYFNNIHGTVLNSSVPYYIVCANGGCSDWEWEDVSIFGQKNSTCVNFHPDGIECIDYKI